MMRRGVVAAILVPILLTLAAGAAVAREFEREFTFATDDLKVVNMIGTVQVVEAPGDEFQIQVTVRGEDATEDFLEFAELNDDGEVFAIKFPIQKHTKYVYPELGRGSKTTMSFDNEDDHGKSWLKKVFSGMSGTRVTVSGKGNGKEVWADMVIAVPRGAELEMRLGVGEIAAGDLKADLNLDTSSGAIQVTNLEGDLLADTGSGHVMATGIDGEVNIDTGSGHVEVTDCEGREIKVDTGSGRVIAENVKCDNLDIDTGSGSVKARRIATDQARIDTGSGSVVLQLDRMGDGKFDIDTGSGSIELIMPDDASARISADTGSGSVNNDFAGSEVVRKDKREMELIVGDGESRVRLDAGSGSITVAKN
jgi:hypothetical protein